MCSDATRLPFSQQKVVLIPRVPDVFLACGGDFRCWPKAEAARKNFRAGHYKDLQKLAHRVWSQMYLKINDCLNGVVALMVEG